LPKVVYHLIDVETQKHPTYLVPGSEDRVTMVTQEVTLEDDGTLHIWVYTRQKDDREAWLKRLMRSDILKDGKPLSKIHYIRELRDWDFDRGRSLGLREYKELVEKVEREILDD